jgi:hypothetical protein
VGLLFLDIGCTYSSDVDVASTLELWVDACSIEDLIDVEFRWFETIFGWRFHYNFAVENDDVWKDK